MEEKDKSLRSAALLTSQGTLRARERAELELVEAKESLEGKTRELAASLSLTRATLEATTDALMVSDVSGNITDFNQKFLEVWRGTPSGLASGNHRELLQTSSNRFGDVAGQIERLDAIHAAPDAPSFDLLALLDGRFLERTSTPHVVGQRVVGRVWSFRDVTERERVAELERDERRVLELGTVIASTLELEDLVQRVTDVCTELSGASFGAFFYTVTDASGGAVVLYTLSGAPREAFERFGHPRATALFGPTFDGKPPIRIADVKADPRYGSMGPHHGMPPGHLPVRSYLAVPVVSRTGAAIGGLFFGHPDIGVFSERSERLVVGVAAQVGVAMDNARLYEDVKRAAAERATRLDAERSARSEVERVSAMKDEFLATLSHELRTPLNAVLGWSELLTTKAHAEAQVAHAVDAIVRNARAQARLIDDLLDMNQIISGKIRLDVQPTDVPSVTSAAVDSVRPSAEAKSIALETVIDPGAGTVSGDPNRLQQVIWNLLSNAVKFTPRGGRVTVRVAREGSLVRVTVEDSGQGIDPLFVPHVFERFRQADSSTTRKAGGLGLGLSIVKQLVELHGGTVHAESDGLGHGSTFIVRLPVAAICEREVGERREPSGEGSSGGWMGSLGLLGIKVLVVDDERDVRDLLKALLSAAEAEVIEATSADEALATVLADRPDVIISDVGMPERDGYQFIRSLRRLPADRGGATPAIALTAFARSEDRTRSMRAGFQLHLSKPVELQEVIAAILSLTGRTSDVPSQ